MSNEINEINQPTEIQSTEVESTITTESILTPEYVTFDELKLKFNQVSIPEILTIKKYLPILHKQVLIDNIISSAKEIDDNGMTRINYTNLELFFDIHLTETISNYGFYPETMIEEYDYMVEHGIFELIYNEFSKHEINNIRKLVYKEIEQELKVSNSIEGIINSHLYLLQDKIDTLISKIPDFKEDTVNKWVKSLSKTLKQFDPSKTEMVQSILDLNKSK